MTQISKALLCLFVLFAAGSSIAQIELNPSAGLNFTDFSKDPTTGSSSANVGWQVGGTVSFGTDFYGEGGIFWVYKSNKFTEHSTSNTFSTDISGIRIPAMIGFHLVGEDDGMVGLRAFGGGSVFVLTDVKNPFGLSNDEFADAHVGVFAGVGVDLSIFFVDAKYEWSLTDIHSATSFTLGKSRTIFVNGGVRFPL